MGNQKCLIPNAWFYKLNKHSNNNNNHPHKPLTLKHHHLSPPPPILTGKSTTNPRKSYHFTRDLTSTKTGFDIQLPPILTKPKTNPNSSPTASGGFRLRKTTFAGARKKHQQGHDGNFMTRISESSMAVVKTSRDPQRDFRESMVEMIVENHLTAAKDLEELLASYLSLNSKEYHYLIIKVFKQIWLDLISSITS